MKYIKKKSRKEYLIENKKMSNKQNSMKKDENSLNINITNAVLETVSEALKIYKNQMQDTEKYIIQNFLGFVFFLKLFNLPY